MTHQIRARFDTNSSPSDAEMQYQSWKDDFREVLSDRSSYEEVPERFDGQPPAYTEIEAFFDIRDDPSAIVTALTDTYFPDVDWMAVHSRRNDTELDLPEYADDPAYYDPNLSDGLRTPVELERSDKFTIENDDIHYVIGGSEYTAQFGSFDVDRPDTGPPKDVNVYVNTSSEISFSGSLKIAELEVHPGKVVDISPVEIEQITEDWGQPDVEQGSPPTPFVDSSESFPDPVSLEEKVRELEERIVTLEDQHGNI